MEREFLAVIDKTKSLMSERRYEECEAELCTAMFQFPHDAVPHNLMGLMLEKENLHEEAMKHFRAALALDPTYLPAAWNLECFGDYVSPHPCAYRESDCVKTKGKKSEGR